MSFYKKFRPTAELTLTQTNPIESVQNQSIMLEIVEHGQALRTPVRKRLILGRHDPNDLIRPDVDLTPFAGYRNGVSRNHARLSCNEQGYIEITDLGSSNGTYVNQRHIRPHSAYVVRNGDRLKLGKLEIIVRYPEENSLQ